MPTPTGRYSTLIRRHRDYRLLWLGQVVSQLGDWFNTVAVYALLYELTGSATSVAIMFVVQQMPSAFVGPWAGVLVDRLDRRRVMIAADLLRGVAVLGLLAVRSADLVWLTYAVMGVMVVGTSFFEPARSAVLPSVVPTEDLVLANSLSSVTWATMLTVGAAVGGMVTAWLGRDVSFVLNSASFFLSAVLISRMRLTRRLPTGAAEAARRTGLTAGLAYLASARDVRAYVSVKASWAVAGGVMLLLTVFGGRVFALGGGAALGIGVLYAARGIGSGLGAFAVRGLARADRRQLERSLAPAFLAIGLAYASLSIVPNIWLAALAVSMAHAAGAIVWVASTVLLQMAVPDSFRGRVFAIEYALLMLVSSSTGYVTGVGLDVAGVGPRALAATLGAIFLVPAVAWWARARRLSPSPADATA